MKQSKATLFIGILFAIIALVFVVNELKVGNESPNQSNPSSIENAEITPVVYKSIATIKELILLR